MNLLQGAQRADFRNRTISEKEYRTGAGDGRRYRHGEILSLASTASIAANEGGILPKAFDNAGRQDTLPSIDAWGLSQVSLAPEAVSESPPFDLGGPHAGNRHHRRSGDSIAAGTGPQASDQADPYRPKEYRGSTRQPVLLDTLRIRPRHQPLSRIVCIRNRERPSSGRADPDTISQTIRPSRNQGSSLRVSLRTAPSPR